MIDYAAVKPGDRPRITWIGAPGFASLGDEVVVLQCTTNKCGSCLVENPKTRATARFHLACGAARLERIEAVDAAGGAA